MIKENLTLIQGRIDAVCGRIGRNPDGVTLLGASKYATVAQIKEAVGAGLTHIGENRVQDALVKFQALDQMGLKVTKHMIGHLQTNKVKQAVEIFDVIQSVDSLRLVDEIEKRSAELDKRMDILLEVNTSGEGQKFGVNPVEVISLVGKILKCPHVRLRGLMAMAPLTGNQEVLERCFRDLRELFDAVEDEHAGRTGIAMDYLSMGMSGDYGVALEQGSTMVRIGRAIFQ